MEQGELGATITNTFSQIL